MKERVIQKVVAETKYIASDRKEFDTKWECEQHERLLNAKIDEEILRAVKQVDATNGYDSQGCDYGAECYYLRNKEEYAAMIRCWFDYNYDEGENNYMDMPEEDNWQFLLWVYVSGREEFGYEVMLAQNYIDGVKRHIQRLEDALKQTGAYEEH